MKVDMSNTHLKEVTS